MEALPHELWKGISFYELAGLCTVLVGEGDWLKAFPEARMSSNEETAVYAFPSELEAALAELPKTALASKAIAWTETDEGTSLSEEDAVSILTRLRELAVDGRKKKRRLYLQM